jgi:enoyl-CoA hydratase/carnithine racemase
MNIHSTMIEHEFSGAILSVTLARPPVNAIDEEWIDQFNSVLDELDDRPITSVVLVTSSERLFSAGFDLRLVRSCVTGERTADEMIDAVQRLQRLYDRIENLPQVTIAVIGGSAFGGGLELALACDLRIAAADAQLGLPEAKLGLLPGAGGTQRLTRLCGSGMARRLILTAETMTGAEARERGVVQWAVPGDAISGFSAELAERVSSIPSSALAACKQCLAAAENAIGPGLSIEVLATSRLLANEQTRAGIAEFFARRRKDGP